MTVEAIVSGDPPGEERLEADDERAWLDLLARISRQSVFARARCEAPGKTRALWRELGLLTWPYTRVWSHFGILRS